MDFFRWLFVALAAFFVFFGAGCAAQDARDPVVMQERILNAAERGNAKVRATLTSGGEAGFGTRTEFYGGAKDTSVTIHLEADFTDEPKDLPFERDPQMELIN